MSETVKTAYPPSGKKVYVKDLAKVAAEEVNVPVNTAEKVIKAAIDVIKHEAVTNHAEIKLGDFCTLKPGLTSGGERRNPFNGGKIMTQPKKRYSLKFCKKFNDELKDSTRYQEDS